MIGEVVVGCPIFIMMKVRSSHQENPVFSFCTFPYFFLLFCKKVEKEIPSTF